MKKFKNERFFWINYENYLGRRYLSCYGNFKQRVFLPAQKELEKKTDISFEIKIAKKGRKVEKVKFVIQAVKQKTNEQLDLFEENLKRFQLPNSFLSRVKN